MQRIQLEVYQTDAEAFEATAELAAEQLRAAAVRGRADVALAGGRGGRGVMLALAARGDLPWDRIEWWLGDERCVAPTDPLSNFRLARESLFVPRGVAAARIHPPPLAAGDAARVADEYGRVLIAGLGSPPVLDVVLLGLGADGHVASLMPGCAALAATVPVAAVDAAEVTGDPRVARITFTPPVLRAARHVIVTVTGDEKAAAVATALRGPEEPTRVPAHLVRPSATVTWIVDRAAAAILLRAARPAEQ